MTRSFWCIAADFLLTVIADDNRPNMLVGLIVRTKQKRPAVAIPPHMTGIKKPRVRPEDEPYEPPGIDDGEPHTLSPKSTPKLSTSAEKDARLLDSQGKTHIQK